ncbi:MAG: Gfo/Idh/MocA family oxidoreductase, partial [Catalinimonas sp.]
MDHHLNRRTFLHQGGTLAAAAALAPTLSAFAGPPRKMRVAMVGTGTRGINMWGRALVEEYPESVEFVGLCDTNPGRLEYGRSYMGVNCPTFTDFDQMMRRVKPDALIVTTVDATHHTFIVKGLEMGADIITEKPMTTDEAKCRQILDAERRT